jgi:hypothetical protein
MPAGSRSGVGSVVENRSSSVISARKAGFVSPDVAWFESGSAAAEESSTGGGATATTASAAAINAFFRSARYGWRTDYRELVILWV